MWIFLIGGLRHTVDLQCYSKQIIINGLVWIIAKAIELPSDRQKWREIHCCVLMQQHLQRRLLASRLRRSWHLESVVRSGENELVRCFVSVPYMLSPSSSFSLRFRLCSFFNLFSHLASLISSYVQFYDGAHKAERSSNASEHRTVWPAIQGMTTKLLLFPKLRTVWFSCVVVLRLVPVVAGKDPVQVGCSGVGGLARFQIFPGYSWIWRMRVQTESCWVVLPFKVISRSQNLT